MLKQSFDGLFSVESKSGPFAFPFGFSIVAGLKNAGTSVCRLQAAANQRRFRQPVNFVSLHPSRPCPRVHRESQYKCPFACLPLFGVHPVWLLIQPVCGHGANGLVYIRERLLKQSDPLILWFHTLDCHDPNIGIGVPKGLP